MSNNRNVVPFGTRHGATVRFKTTPKTDYSCSRKPVTPSKKTVRGYFPSAKMKRSLGWESPYEWRACYRFEFSPAVISYYEQPQPIRFWCGEKYSKYTPDFKLGLSNGETWFVEIKPYAYLQRPDIAERLSLASEWYRDNGFRFIVITDKELIHPDLESNLKLIKYFQNHELLDMTIDHARNWLLQADPPSIGNMNEYFGDKETAFVLLCHHQISTDLTVPFSLNSELYLPEEDYYATLLFSYRTAPYFELCSL